MKLCFSIFLLVGALTSYAAFEIEPNDSSAAANSIVPGQNTTGQLASATDQDWFGFSMSSAGTVSVVFDSPANSSAVGAGYHTIQVRNAAGTVFASVETGRDTSFQTGLPSAGTYFVVVKDGPNPNMSTDQYGLTVTTTAPPAPAVVQAQIYTAAEVVWNSTLGKFYVVEWSADMSANSWFPLTPSSPGTGNAMSYLDSIRGETKAFYRVKEN